MLTRRNLLPAGLSLLAARRAWAAADDGLVGGTAPASSAGDIPVRFEAQPLITARINDGPECVFGVDTGSSLTIIDRPAARAAGLTLAGEAAVRGAGDGRHATDLAADVVISAGPVRFPALPAIVMDLPNRLTDRGKAPPMAGLLGLAALSATPCQLDAKAGLLRILPAGEIAPPGGFDLQLDEALAVGGTMAGRRAYQKLIVAVELDGLPLSLIVDTGAGGVLVVSPKTVQTAGLSRRYRHIDMLAPAGIDDAQLMSFGFGGTLRVGAADIAFPAFALRTEDEGARACPGRRPASPLCRVRNGVSADGLLGIGALARLSPFIDTANGTITLYKPPAAATQKRPGIVSTGLSLDKPRHDAFTIVDAVAGSPADRAGIRHAGPIVAMNDIPATDLSLHEAGRLGRSGLRVRFESGKTVQLAAETLLQA